MKNQLFVSLALAALAQSVMGAPVVTSGGGLAAATTARDAFRTMLGGGLVAGANGSFGGARREINWDGVPDALSSPNALPANFFNANSPRGVVFSTPGTGFQVSATAASGTPVRFGNINATYPGTFTAFSPQRLFTAVGSPQTDVNFFGPGTNLPATTSGFGSIFTDVDIATSTSIQLFDSAGNSLGIFAVPVGDVSFLGVTFDAGERVARARIVSGNAALGPNDAPPGTDVVAMDDFLFGEPQLLAIAARPIPTLTQGAMGVLLATLALFGAMWLRRRR